MLDRQIATKAHAKLTIAATPGEGQTVTIGTTVLSLPFGCAYRNGKGTGTNRETAKILFLDEKVSLLDGRIECRQCFRLWILQLLTAPELLRTPLHRLPLDGLTDRCFGLSGNSIKHLVQLALLRCYAWWCNALSLGFANRTVNLTARYLGTKRLGIETPARLIGWHHSGSARRQSDCPLLKRLATQAANGKAMLSIFRVAIRERYACVTTFGLQVTRQDVSCNRQALLIMAISLACPQPTGTNRQIIISNQTAYTVTVNTNSTGNNKASS